MACYPSKFIPHYPGMKDWLDAGNDFLPDVVSRSRDLGLEVFFSFRVNSGQDPNFDSVSFKDENEGRLLNFNEDPDGLPQLFFRRLDGQVNQLKWDYANPAVRDYQVSALRELATYDIDGIQLDFARHAPYVHVGHQWELREHVTRFMRDVRSMMQRCGGHLVEGFIHEIDFTRSVFGEATASSSIRAHRADGEGAAAPNDPLAVCGGDLRK